MSATDSRRGATAAGLAFGLLAADVVRGGRLARWEQRQVPAPPAGSGPWRTITALGDRPATAAITLAAAAITASRGGNPAVPIATVAGGVAVRAWLMRAIDRDRPPTDRWREEPEGASFPSRHAASAASAALALLALRRALPATPATTIGVGALIAVECWSRVRLGVHWPTDVAGGVLLAIVADGIGGCSPCTREARR